MAHLMERRDSRSIGLPRFGYLLESEGIVGVILQIFATLRSGETCRNSVQCFELVRGTFLFRSYSSLLVAKALSHKNVTYLNVTPAPNTLSILEAQGYLQYSRGIFVAAPALQLRLGGADVRVDRVSARRPTHADPFDHDLLMEHAKYGCMSLWSETADRAYPFVFRPCIIKGGITCARLVYCTDVDDFVRFAGPLGRFLALRGRPLVLIDSNGPIPGLVGKYLDAKMPRYFLKEPEPAPAWAISLAYSEIAMFGI